jgi:3-oxoacyl-[acyl-carrier protein] reductase
MTPLSTADHDLTGKVALVTGAGRGLGRAYAVRLAALGAAVAVNDLNLEPSPDAGGEEQTVVEEIEALGGQALAQPGDVTDRDAVEAIVAATVEKFGGLDVLVCNAGGPGRISETAEGTATATSDEDWEICLRLNLLGTVNCCRAAVPPMREGGWGKIVNVSSEAAQRTMGSGVGAAYAAAKAGIEAYTRALAEEVGPYGITVNAIAPGSIDTPLTRGAFSDMDDPAAHAKVPLGRFGVPEDCARVIGFLCTPLSDYVTGQVIFVDGGLSFTDALADSGLEAPSGS